MPKMCYTIFKLCTGKPLHKLDVKYGQTLKKKSQSIFDKSTAVVL